MQDKCTVSLQMRNLTGGAIGKGAAGQIGGTPPLLSGHARGPRDPRGGIAAPVSLPLCVTPCGFFQRSEVQK